MFSGLKVRPAAALVVVAACDKTRVQTPAARFALEIVVPPGMLTELPITCPAAGLKVPGREVADTVAVVFHGTFVERIVVHVRNDVRRLRELVSPAVQDRDVVSVLNEPLDDRYAARARTADHQDAHDGTQPITDA